MHSPTNQTSISMHLSELKLRIQTCPGSSEKTDLLYSLQHIRLEVERLQKTYYICDKKLKECQQNLTQKTSDIKNLSKKLRKVSQENKTLSENIAAIHAQKKNGSQRYEAKYKQIQKSYTQLLKNLAQQVQMEEGIVVPGLKKGTSEKSNASECQEIQFWEEHNFQIISKLKEEKNSLVQEVQNLKILNHDLDQENQCLRFLVRQIQICQETIEQEIRDENISDSSAQIDGQYNSDCQEQQAQGPSQSAQELPCCENVLLAEEAHVADDQKSGIWKKILKALKF